VTDFFPIFNELGRIFYDSCICSEFDQSERIMFETNKINAPEKFARNMRPLYLMISDPLMIDLKFILLIPTITSDNKQMFKRFIVLLQILFKIFMHRFRSKRKKRMAYFFTLIGIIIITLLLYSIYALTRFETFLTTEGYVQMELDKIISTTDRNIVVLKGECTEFSFYISLEQAFAINEGLSDQVKFRPMTHDIIVDILEGFEIKPVMVKITTLSENTYFAELTLQEWNRLFILDIRPSDGVAIAVRTNSPIYVNEDLVMKTC